MPPILAGVRMMNPILLAGNMLLTKQQLSDTNPPA
jgi:hypothetical protein